MLRSRFEHVRVAAASHAKKKGKTDLAKRIRTFQFRDICPKAASKIASLEDASKLLGHTDKEITQKVYRRTGKVVKPTRES
jgi:integrase